MIFYAGIFFLLFPILFSAVYNMELESIENEIGTDFNNDVITENVLETDEKNIVSDEEATDEDSSKTILGEDINDQKMRHYENSDLTESDILGSEGETAMDKTNEEDDEVGLFDVVSDTVFSSLKFIGHKVRNILHWAWRGISSKNE